MAQALVAGGKVRVNREKVTHPARLVRCDDVLTIATPREIRVVRVVGFSDRRVSAPAVATLYEAVGEQNPSDGPEERYS